MTALLQTCGRLARALQARPAAVDAIYKPATGAAYSVALVPGTSWAESQSDGGVIISRQLQAFICEVVQLDDYPVYGDVITVPSWGNRRFQVGNPQGSREAVYHDNYGDSLRIFTVECSPAPPEPDDVVGVIYAAPTVEEGYSSYTGIIYGGPQ